MRSNATRDASYLPLAEEDAGGRPIAANQVLSDGENDVESPGNGNKLKKQESASSGSSAIDRVLSAIGMQKPLKDEDPEDSYTVEDCLCDTRFDKDALFCKQCGRNRKKVWLMSLVNHKDKLMPDDFQQLLVENHRGKAHEHFERIDHNKSMTIDRDKWMRAVETDIVHPEMFKYTANVKLGEKNDEGKQLRLFDEGDVQGAEAIYFCGQPIDDDGKRCGYLLDRRDVKEFGEHQKLPDTICHSCVRYNLDKETDRINLVVKDRQEIMDYWKSAYEDGAKQLDETLKKREAVSKRLAKLEVARKKVDEIEPVPEPPGPASLRWVKGDRFVILTGVIIIINLWTMTLEMLDNNYKQQFFWPDQFFLLFYIIEIVLKGLLYRRELLFGDCGVSWWNWLDLIIVVGGVVDQWLKPMFLIATGGHPAGGGSLFNVLRVLRLARVFKLAQVFFKSDLSWTKAHHFQLFIMGVIAFNSVMIWLENDVPFGGWVYIEQAMLVIYVFELLVRLRLEGCAFFYDEDMGWNWMDLMIVLGAVLDQWILPIAHMVRDKLTHQRSSSDDNMGQVMMMLRMARLLRILRLVRLIKHIQQLYDLCLGLTKAMAGMFWVSLLTVVIIYMFALVCDTLIGRGLAFPHKEVPPEVQENFSDVFECWFVLFKAMNGDFESFVPLWEVMPIAKLFTVLWVVISSWAILSLLTSVVTENMMKATEDRRAIDEEEERKHKLKISQTQLNDIFDEVDQDGSGFITQTEWNQLTSNTAQMCKLKRVSLVDKDSLNQLFNSASETYAVENHDEEASGKCDVERRIKRKAFIEHLQNESHPVTERSVLMISSRLAKVEKQLETRVERLERNVASLMDHAEAQQDLVVERTSIVLAKCMEIYTLIDKDNQEANLEEIAKYEHRLQQERKSVTLSKDVANELDHFYKMHHVDEVATAGLGALKASHRFHALVDKAHKEHKEAKERSVQKATPSVDSSFNLSVSTGENESPTKCTVEDVDSMPALLAKLAEKLKTKQEIASLEYWDPHFEGWHLPGDDISHIPKKAKVRIDFAAPRENSTISVGPARMSSAGAAPQAQASSYAPSHSRASSSTPPSFGSVGPTVLQTKVLSRPRSEARAVDPTSQARPASTSSASAPRQASPSFTSTTSQARPVPYMPERVAASAAPGGVSVTKPSASASSSATFLAPRSPSQGARVLRSTPESVDLLTRTMLPGDPVMLPQMPARSLSDTAATVLTNDSARTLTESSVTIMSQVITNSPQAQDTAQECDPLNVTRAPFDPMGVTQLPDRSESSSARALTAHHRLPPAGRQ